VEVKKMNSVVRIGDRLVGDGLPCFIVAEIGINHNGDLEIAKKLIDVASLAGCDAVKFQKRTVEVVYSPEELAKPRENPFGPTNGDLKRGLEFGQKEYEEIDAYCRDKKILWFASCWDEGAVDFIEQFNPPCYKIASASLTDDNLLRYHRRYGRPIIISTGMSTLDEIDHAVDVLGHDDLVVLHCTSTYPSQIEELNLSAIRELNHRYGVPTGYSGHEVGLAPSVGAAVLGACVIERHITLDRAMWGSDQAASVEWQGFWRLVKDIRALEKAMGDGVKRVYPSEVPIIKKLRRIGASA
jgi:N-acetylneuraminate synthase